MPTGIRRPRAAEKSADDRLTRDQEDMRGPVHEPYEDTWEDPTLLDTSHMPARPGYVQRWVRTKINGEDDATNLMRKSQQGWRPRRADTVETDVYIPKIDFNGVEVIGMQGMVLMERPESLHKAHAARIRRDTDAQAMAAENNMFKVHRPGEGFGAPQVVEHRTRTSRGRRPDVLDD